MLLIKLTVKNIWEDQKQIKKITELNNNNNDSNDLEAYALIGFGSGIVSGMYLLLLKIACGNKNKSPYLYHEERILLPERRHLLERLS